MLFNYWLTYSVLKAKRPKFQRMRAPTFIEAEEGKQAAEPAETAAQGAYHGNGVH